MAERKPYPIINTLLRFGLFAKAPGTSNKRSFFNIAVQENEIRFSVSTNIPEDKNKSNGMITAKFTPMQALEVARQLIEIAQSKEKIQYVTKIKSAIWEDNKMTDKMTEKNTLLTGRDKEGIIYIVLQAPGRPNIKFDFLEYELFETIMNGEKKSKVTQSEHQAIIWAKALEEVIYRYCLDFKNSNTPAISPSIPEYSGGETVTTTEKMTTPSSDFSDIDF